MDNQGTEHEKLLNGSGSSASSNNSAPKGMALSMDNASHLKSAKLDSGNLRAASAGAAQAQNMSAQQRSSVSSGSLKSQSRKGVAAKSGAQSANKEKKYYHVQISKLADAFENQFFTSIAHIEALDTLPRQQAGQQQKVGADGKPKRVFENMTIHKQYNEYHELKDSLYAQLGSINSFSNLIMVIGVTYLIFLTVSLFIDAVKEPVAVIVSHAIVFSGDIGDIVVTEKDAWTIILFKITGFMCAICFILLGTYIAYYKSVIKVDTIKQVKQTSIYCLIAFVLIGCSHSALVIFFAFMEDYNMKEENKDSDYNLQKKESTSIGIAIVIQMAFFFLELLTFIVTFRKIREAHSTMLVFHDYLIQYRLTPRSRLLRKHLPKMTMVLEEESNMDTSSMMLSQSRIMSVSQNTARRKKFVYRDPTPHASQENQEENGDSDTSSEEMSQNEEDFENDMLVFDKDQAEAIRTINKLGSMKSANLDSANMNLIQSNSPLGQGRAYANKLSIASVQHELSHQGSLVTVATAKNTKHHKSPEIPVRQSADAAAYLQSSTENNQGATNSPRQRSLDHHSSINNSPKGNSQLSVTQDGKAMAAVSVENPHSPEM